MPSDPRSCRQRSSLFTIGRIDVWDVVHISALYDLFFPFSRTGLRVEKEREAPRESQAQQLHWTSCGVLSLSDRVLRTRLTSFREPSNVSFRKSTVHDGLVRGVEVEVLLCHPVPELLWLCDGLFIEGFIGGLVDVWQRYATETVSKGITRQHPSRQRRTLTRNLVLSTLAIGAVGNLAV